MKKRVLPVLLALGVVLGQAQGVYAAVEEAPQAAVEEAPQAAEEEAPQAAEEEAPQAAVEEAPQAAVEEAPQAAEEKAAEIAVKEVPQAAEQKAEVIPASSATETAPKNAQNEQNKDVWIDNTVDNSVSYVTVVVDLTGSAGMKKTIVDKQKVNVTFSNPESAEVKAIADEAKTEVDTWIGKAKSGNYEITKTETPGKVWDNRKYETVEDNDAILIGDTGYIPDPGQGGSITRTHIASGDYGKETTFLYEIKGEASAYELSESHTGNGSVIIDVDTELEGTNVALAGDSVTVRMRADDNNFIKTYSVFKGDKQMEAAVFGDNTEQEAATAFKMPAADVQISAEFKEISEYTAICLGTTEGGSYSVDGNGLMPQEDLRGPIDMTVPVNGKITLTAAADSGYVFKGWYAGIVDESSFVHENDGTRISEDASYTFTIPGDEVLAIQAVFEEKKEEEETATPETPKDEEPPKQETSAEEPAKSAAVEEKKGSSSDSESSASEKKSSKKKSAPTGDESNPLIPAVVMGTAMIGIALVAGRKRRNF